MKLIYAEERPTSGDVRVSGYNVNEPTVILADEPTGNLDERATRGVFQLLRDINASGTAVVMATHDLDLVRQAPYRVINLQDALHGVEERVEVVAYLLPGAPIEATAQALKDIEAFPEVQSATYVSEDDALARARAELVELRDVMQELERNPLPASIEVKLKP